MSPVGIRRMTDPSVLMTLPTNLILLCSRWEPGKSSACGVRLRWLESSSGRTIFQLLFFPQTSTFPPCLPTLDLGSHFTEQREETREGFHSPCPRALSHVTSCAITCYCELCALPPGPGLCWHWNLSPPSSRTLSRLCPLFLWIIISSCSVTSFFSVYKVL